MTNASVRERPILVGELLFGNTPVGRATIQALALNRPLIVEIRGEETLRGRHPHAPRSVLGRSACKRLISPSRFSFVRRKKVLWPFGPTLPSGKPEMVPLDQDAFRAPRPWIGKHWEVTDAWP